MEISRKGNCFNFIRMIAAMQVFLGHASEHLDVALPHIVQHVLTCFNGVPIFFLLSGFLIWNSIGRTASFKQYAAKRLFRVYPELWGGCCVNAVVMVLLYAENIRWFPFLLFQITQGSVLQFWTPDCLRGYGVGTPNGSLWTVGVIVQCYVVIWFVYRFLHGKRIHRWAAALILGILLNCVFSTVMEMLLPELLYKLSMQTFFPYIWLFLLGAFVSEYFETIGAFIVKFWWLWLAADAVVSLTGFDLGRYGTLQGISLALLIIGFGYRFPQIQIKHDISYGFYIYHMVVINAMVWLGMLSKWYDMLISLAVSTALAAVSYVGMNIARRKVKTMAVSI